MGIPCTGIILAGGLNSRFKGKNKAFAKVGNTRIIDRVYEVFTEFFDEIILVTNDPVSYVKWDFTIVTDIFKKRSSLTGIHAGLFSANNSHAFVAACDAPFLKKEVIQTILDKTEERFDVIIPETSRGLEPLCAVYSKRCLKPMERNIERDRFKIRLLFNKLKLRKVSEKAIYKADSE
ncbi:molybdenum cofactor guanylyltransferase, partial [Desulfobacterales bacterium HSG16]|nr:molybdenum cofactor guanylyltransferase [Desulfobacterales bacterium HSG16]